MKEVSSEDLLTMISIDPNEPECKQAFNEFHRRFKDFVWNISYKVSRELDNYNAENIAMILTQNTFMDVYKNAGAFNQNEEVNQDDRIRIWLSGIVKNMAKRYLDENNKHKNHIVFMEMIPSEIEPEFNPNNYEKNENIVSFERKLLKYALNSLDKKHRTVLLSWYNFSDGIKIRNIDKEIKENLAKQFNVKVDSLKKIKQRALEQVKCFIEKHETKTKTYAKSR